MHALFVTTSSDQLAPGHPTGLWLEEFAVPYIAVTEAGITVTVASPKGGAVPLDPKTEPNETQRKNWAVAIQALCHSVTLDSVKEEHFDAIFIPGGHGPMVDLANDTTLHALVARHDAAGKLIAAVCHGPAALVNARRRIRRRVISARWLLEPPMTHPWRSRPVAVNYPRWNPGAESGSPGFVGRSYINISP